MEESRRNDERVCSTGLYIPKAAVPLLLAIYFVLKHRIMEKASKTIAPVNNPKAIVSSKENPACHHRMQ